MSFTVFLLLFLSAEAAMPEGLCISYVTLNLENDSCLTCSLQDELWALSPPIDNLPPFMHRVVSLCYSKIHWFYGPLNWLIINLHGCLIDLYQTDVKGGSPDHTKPVSGNVFRHTIGVCNEKAICCFSSN